MDNLKSTFQVAQVNLGNGTLLSVYSGTQNLSATVKRTDMLLKPFKVTPVKVVKENDSYLIRPTPIKVNILGLLPTCFASIAKKYGLDFSDEDFKRASNMHSGHPALRTIANEQVARGLNMIIAHACIPNDEQRDLDWPDDGDRIEAFPAGTVRCVCLGDKFAKTIGILDQTFEWSPYMLWAKNDNERIENALLMNRERWHALVRETKRETDESWTNH